MAMPVHPTSPLPEQQRAQILDQALIAKAAQGGRLETRTATTGVVIMGKPVNHILHLLLSVLTCGFWLWVWLLIAAVGGEQRRILTVDEFGQVRDTRGPLETYRKILIGIAGVLLILWITGAVSQAFSHSSSSSFAPLNSNLFAVTEMASDGSDS